MAGLRTVPADFAIKAICLLPNEKIHSWTERYQYYRQPNCLENEMTDNPQVRNKETLLLTLAGCTAVQYGLDILLSQG